MTCNECGWIGGDGCPKCGGNLSIKPEHRSEEDSRAASGSADEILRLLDKKSDDFERAMHKLSRLERALDRILTDSAGADDFNNCLACGGINETAAHALFPPNDEADRLETAKPSVNEGA